MSAEWHGQPRTGRRAEQSVPTRLHTPFTQTTIFTDDSHRYSHAHYTLSSRSMQRARATPSLHARCTVHTQTRKQRRLCLERIVVGLPATDILLSFHQRRLLLTRIDVKLYDRRTFHFHEKFESRRRNLAKLAAFAKRIYQNVRRSIDICIQSNVGIEKRFANSDSKARYSVAYASISREYTVHVALGSPYQDSVSPIHA